MQNTAPSITSMNQPSINAWSLRAWPTLLWQAESSGSARFTHVSTRVEWQDAGMGPPSGQTVWAMADNGSQAGMAWDWVQIGHGVVAIADPMSVVSNLRLVSEGGVVLTTQQAALYLNRLVRGLPWQAEVRRALQSRSN